MKYRRIILFWFCILMAGSVLAREKLELTFGAPDDLAASYGGSDVTSTTTQGADIAAPAITITGLDIDGIGGNDDQIEVVFAVSATGGTLDRLSQGYRLEQGYALTFEITSYSLTLGNGGSGYTIDEIGFVSTAGNNSNPYSVTSTDSGFTTLTDASSTQSLIQDPGIDGLSQFTMTSTATDNNRGRNIIAEFEIAEVVAPVPPVANGDSFEVDKNTIFTNAVPGVLANDTDANGDTLSAIQVASPTNGSLLSFSSDGSFIYRPDSGFTGTDTFTYQATDGGLTSGVATVTLDVNGVPITLPHILQSNMVLQRNKPIPVWGWGAVGDKVAVSLSSGQNEVTTVDAHGRWELALTAMAATNGPLTLLISTPDSSVTLTNLVVGDVWFCSGQSNAGWQLAATDGGAEEVAAANYPNFRLIRVARHELDAPSDDPVDFEGTLDWDEETGALKDKAGKWFVCNPEKAGYFGAVFYYAGKELHLNLGIPIGIIQSAYAGTPMEAWAKTSLPEAHPPGSDPADPQRLYNGMVYPYLRIPITGAAWYQGERNHDDGGHIVTDKLRIMIDDWRAGWGRGDFPFYYIQIPPVFRWNTEAEADPMLPYFWEAQTRVMDVSTNTYMIVSSDTTSGALHPKNKRPVGKRMGMRMLKNTYGFSSIQDQGPVFTHAVKEGSRLRLYFDEIGGGLALNTNIGFNANGDLQIDINEALAGEDYDKDGKIDQWGEDLNHNGVLDAGEDIDGDGILDLSEYDINFPYLTWFEICDAEGNFTNATATIDGDTIVVSAPSIPNPVGVRYAWSRFAIGNLMNAEGLPARLFRQTPLFARGENYSTVQENALYIAPAGILNNDEPASTLRPIERPIVATNTANGALTLRSDGAFIYSPNAGFNGTDSFAYVATDGVETSPEAVVQIDVQRPGSEMGSITREVWTDVPGYRLTDLLENSAYPESPDLVETLSSLDAPRDWDNSYGQRIHGYLHAPTNGNYTFWIASAARSKLFLSTDTDPSNAVEICECPVSNDDDPENWTSKAAQQSDPIALVGGQKYYIEILHKDAGSIDNCSVAWDLTPGTTNIIDGAYLSPIQVDAPVVSNYSGWCNWFGVSGNEHLLDFAFNLDPTIADDDEGLPDWVVSDTDGLVVEYQRRKNVPGLSYTVQFTDNLQANWVDSTASKSVLPVNDIWEHVTVEDETDPASATNRFGRVIVIQE